MRYCELIVDGDYISKLDISNASALPVAFTINAYDDITDAVPSVITLKNVPLSLISQKKSFWQGKKITLNAGLRASPLYQSTSFASEVESPIFVGAIDSVVTNYDGRDTWLSFLCSGCSDDISAPIHIKQGENIASAFLTLLREHFPNITWIDKTASTAEITWQNKQSEEKIFKNIQQIATFLSKYKIKIRIENSKGTLYVDKSAASTNGASNTSEAVEIDYTLDARDLLAQPKYISATGVEVVVTLNGKYQLGQKIALPTNSITSTGALLGDFSGDALALRGNVQSLIGGNFEILEIAHTGDTSSNDAKGWATTLRGVTTTALDYNS